TDDEIPELLRTPAVGSYIALTLNSDSGPIAQLFFLSPQARAFSPNLQEMARKVVGHLEIAFHHARLFEEVRAGRQRLQSLSQRLVEAHEVERRQIARELHDEIGQQLTGLKLMMEMDSHIPPTGNRHLQEAVALVNDLMERVRALSLDLR